METSAGMSTWGQELRQITVLEYYRVQVVPPSVDLEEPPYNTRTGTPASSRKYNRCLGSRVVRILTAVRFGLNKDLIVTDLTKERPQWILSAYGPTKEVPVQLMGGYPREQSFEEARLLHYRAAATGNPAYVQQVAQEIQGLVTQAEQQIQTILGDLDGAVRYITAGKDSHPNRWDICKASTGATGQEVAGPRSVVGQSANAFGQPSASGNLSSGSSFGQHSQRIGAFGQPSQLGGATPAFEQPSQIGAAPSGFGRPSSGSVFGKPSQLGGSPFGQSAQSGGGQAFGTPTAFGWPSQVGGSSGSFGQPSQLGTSPLFSQTADPPSSQMNSNPFARVPAGPSAGVFERPSQIQTNPFTSTHQPSQVSPGAIPAPAGVDGTWQKDETGNPVPFPIEVANPYPDGSKMVHPDLRTYSTRDPSNRLLTWKSKPVIYVGNKPCFERSQDKKMERISYPDGPPAYNKDTELPESMYDEKTRDAYLFMRDKGYFKDDWMPNLPPRREWCKWDF